MKFPILLLVLCVTQGVGAAEVMRWVDEHGVVNYGTSVPRQYRNSATPVPIQAPPRPQPKQADTPAQKAAARPSQSPAPVTAGDEREAEQPPEDARPKAAAGSCEAQWREYEESYACFDPYRVRDGGIKTEAFEHCKEVKMPECERPPGLP